MVDEKNLEGTQGTGADEGAEKVQLGKKTESEEARADSV